jgi:hypothetical protein
MEVAQRKEDAFKLLLLGAHLRCILKEKKRSTSLSISTVCKGLNSQQSCERFGGNRPQR